jgi:hypothetical protein
MGWCDWCQDIANEVVDALNFGSLSWTDVASATTVGSTSVNMTGNTFIVWAGLVKGTGGSKVALSVMPKGQKPMPTLRNAMAMIEITPITGDADEQADE